MTGRVADATAKAGAAARGVPSPPDAQTRPQPAVTKCGRIQVPFASELALSGLKSLQVKPAACAAASKRPALTEAVAISRWVQGFI